MVQEFRPPFNRSSYWDQFTYPTIWKERLEESIPSDKDLENLDYYSIKVDGEEAYHPLPDDYVKYTASQFKEEEDLNGYHNGIFLLST
jgi:hypothetical protein